MFYFSLVVFGKGVLLCRRGAVGLVGCYAVMDGIECVLCIARAYCISLAKNGLNDSLYLLVIEDTKVDICPLEDVFLLSAEAPSVEIRSFAICALFIEFRSRQLLALIVGE